LWRLHRSGGAHVIGWSELRRLGPLPSMRFDPHPPPLGDSAEGVMCAATDVATALAEVFQATRLIDTDSFGPVLTAWQPSRTLRLLDLGGGWPLRNGAAHALTAAKRSTCRAWARAIRSTWPDLDGLRSLSTMTGKPVVVLFSPAADSFPGLPAFSRPLGHPALRLLAESVASELGYRVL
jgi:hypothetical protein